MSLWIDDDDLVCEICEERETVYPYCVSCVNKHLTLMSLVTDGWDYSESAKLSVCEAICVADLPTSPEAFQDFSVLTLSASHS